MLETIRIFRDLLSEAATIFQTYAFMHKAKHTDKSEQKAKANQTVADKIRQTLNSRSL